MLNFTITNWWTLNDAAENLLLLNTLLLIMLGHLYWKTDHFKIQQFSKIIIFWHISLMWSVIRQQPVIHIGTVWQPALMCLFLLPSLLCTNNAGTSVRWARIPRTKGSYRWDYMLCAYTIATLPWIIFVTTNTLNYSTPMMNTSLIYLMIVLIVKNAKYLRLFLPAILAFSLAHPPLLLVSLASGYYRPLPMAALIHITSALAIAFLLIYHMPINYAPLIPTSNLYLFLNPAT